MARHTNNNSFNLQLRELEEEDELQGYDVKNVRRSKKKKVNKFNKGENSYYHDQWMHEFSTGQLNNWHKGPSLRPFFMYYINRASNGH